MSQTTDTIQRILNERDALQKLYSEALACVRRTRKWVRNAEEMAPREAAEMLDGLGNAMQAAYAKFTTGAHEEALAMLRKEDGATEDEEINDDDAPDSE